LRALHGRDDARGADVRGGRRARGGAGREQGRGPSNERRRRHDKTVDRAKSPDRGEVICFACDSTDHHAADLKCPRLAPKSRAAIQRRAEFSDGNKGALNIRREQLRELQQLHNEKKAHFRMLGDNTTAENMGEGRGLDEDYYEDEDGGWGFCCGNEILQVFWCQMCHHLRL